MKSPLVVVIDHYDYEKNNNRRTNIVKRIKNLGFKVKSHPFVWGNKNDDNPVCGADNFVSYGDINLIHSNNICSQEFIKHVLEESSSWILEYSGGGISGLSTSNTRHGRYPHAVGNDGEIIGLRNFLQAIREGSDRDPFLYLKRRKYEYIIALSILCQGYLAVMAESDKENQSSKFGEALKKMKWDEFRDANQRKNNYSLSKLQSKYDDVTSLKWWLEPFDLWDFENDTKTKNTRLLQKYKNDIKDELQASDLEKVELFVNNIIEQGKSPEVDEVAEAFIQISALIDDGG